MTQIVGGLFGVSPEQLQAQRNQALDARAIQLAQLDPFQQAYASIYSGAGRAGRGVAGLLGAEDPELERISTRQKAVQGLDGTNPHSLLQAAQQLAQSGDYAGAQELYAQARKLQEFGMEMGLKQSQITKNLREKEGADPFQQLIRSGKYTPASLAKYEQTGKVDDLENVDKQDHTKLTETKQGIFLIDSRTGEPIKRIGDSPDRGTRIENRTEVKLPADINGIITGYEKAIEPHQTRLKQVTDAQNLINIAMRENNTSAWESARTLVTKAVGNDKLSNADIERMGVDAAIAGRVRDWLNKQVQSVPDQPTAQALYKVAKYLEGSSKETIGKQRIARISAVRSIAPDNKNVEELFPDYTSSGAAVSSGNVVDWADIGKRK